MTFFEKIFSALSLQHKVYDDVEKRIIASELKKIGILTLLCKPADLSVMLINKYLEIKANYSI